MTQPDSIFGAELDRLRRLLTIGEDEPEEKSEQLTLREASRQVLTERPGMHVGRYRLAGVLGEGGMGIVYLADQEQPIKRQVALKVIKPGMDSARVIARFEAERQALALLDHPNIAHVFDAGTTKAGRPYFVMEYVKGLPITDYCDQHKLTIEQRLSLFLQVCEAVQHAHQKGIIHRDIKPSNILVDAGGEKAIPKIIDFGVAKAIAEPLTERTLKTEDSHLLGTPEYMSPEQADMASEDIDTRSDIYSLGVLLYVLLTGTLPFDTKALREHGIEHVRKTIRQTDPKTPSTQLTKLGDAAKLVAENRCTQVGTLTRRLRSELEWIPLKAMRKERSQRYGSASELADDVENYLKSTPLIAGPASTAYRLQKFVRRHKPLVAGLVAVLAVLIAGVIVSSMFAIKARRQAQRLLASIEFLAVDVLGSARDIEGRDATVIDLIDAATAKLDAGAFEDQPLIAESLIRFELGNLIKDLGYPSKAVPHLERVREIYLEHGITPPSTGRTLSGGSRHLIMNYLALAYLHAGERDKAETLFRQIIEEKEATNDLYTDLYPWVRFVLAHIYRLKAQYAESERILLEMMDPRFRNGKGMKPRHMARCRRDLADTYRLRGRYKEAERMYVKVQEIDGQVPSIPLAKLYLDMGHYSEAEGLLRAVIERSPSNPSGRDLNSLINAKDTLARVRTRQGDFNEAERLFTEVREAWREKWSDGRPQPSASIRRVGVLRREQGLYAEAESLLRQALEGSERERGTDPTGSLASKHELALLYIAMEKYEKAERLLLDAYNGREAKLGPEHPRTLDSLRALVDLYESWNKPDEAAEWRARLAGDGSTSE